MPEKQMPRLACFPADDVSLEFLAAQTLVGWRGPCALFTESSDVLTLHCT